MKNEEKTTELIDKIGEALRTGNKRYEALELLDKLQTLMNSTEEKSLDVTSVSTAREKVSDIVVVGNGDMFQLLSKASSNSQKWMKSAKACQVDNFKGNPIGCALQVTTQNRDNVAEAICYIPGVEIVADVNGGRKLQGF